jgi:RHS repeat-associated protein
MAESLHGPSVVRSRRRGLCDDPQLCIDHVTRYVWAGDHLLWELRTDPGPENANLEMEATQGAFHGRVSYTLGGGIDRPLALHKEGRRSIIPHQDWRGQFARGTYADDGAPTECTSSTDQVCTHINWPGKRTTAWHLDSKDVPDVIWFGSQVSGMRDASGKMYMRNRYYDPVTGQFTQTDPIGIAGGLNVYGFAA